MNNNSNHLRLDKLVGGGQTIGTLENGKKAFVWGGLPGETVEFQVTKKKSKLVEGVVTRVISPSPDRIAPRDPDSFLSTSPWQVMSFEREQSAKAQLIDEAFALHGVALPSATEIYSDAVEYNYRNKVEFSWWGDINEQGSETLDLAFFRRGSKGKIPVQGTSLAREEINQCARAVRDVLHANGISARSLKTLLIRCDQLGNCVWQLYVKETETDWKNLLETKLCKVGPFKGGEVIHSDPRSPASRITERIASFGETVLSDTILDVPFRYATEGFFQVNIHVYEQALKDMNKFISNLEYRIWNIEEDPAPTLSNSKESSTERAGNSSDTDSAFPAAATQDQNGRHLAGSGSDEKYVDKSTDLRVVDMYSGVGTIGLTIGGKNCTLVEVDENAVREMRRNITETKSSSQAVLARSEDALEYITGDKIIIVDPPRAGLHTDLVERLLATTPPRIIYLSCNPVTQARDVSLLLDKYEIVKNKGYNFFPRTPHIEHLIVLDKKT
jgi:tRNA/tmRNA/rRNA uracil-C5-methylase (TrmA/RlmC/RlmD family)